MQSLQPPPPPSNKCKTIYAVHKGRQTGLFYNYGEVVESVDGFRGAKHKKFRYPQEVNEAIKFVSGGDPKPKGLTEKLGEDSKLDSVLQFQHPDCPLAASVDELAPLVVFCDGSARPLRSLDQTGRFKFASGFVGTWAIHFEHKGDDREIADYFPFDHPTNNRCEVFACYKALQLIRAKPEDFGWNVAKRQLIIINTDSKYTIEQLANYSDPKMRHHVKLNTELISRLHDLSVVMPVLFSYTPGHSGVRGNERANKAAEEVHRLPRPTLDDLPGEGKRAPAIDKTFCDI